MAIPLAHSLRPQKLSEIVGQRHLIGPDKILTKLIESDSMTNLLFYGPSGTGKSCVAHVIANETEHQFQKFNATTISINDVRKFIQSKGERKLLFLDEIHRLSRNQSDVLLPFVEDGTMTLIGASTENPFHTLSSPLISRSQILRFEPLSEKDLLELLLRGIGRLRLNRPKLKMTGDAAKYVIRVSCGDGRKCLTLLETVTLLSESDEITVEKVRDAAPNKYVIFSDDHHFDLASAFQGSIQASDPDAAIYWLAKWLESGEDPRYVARRLLVAAAEDAYSNPICTAVAHAAFTAAKEIGRPECDILLAQATCLIATSKRDKSAACAIWSALKDVREGKEVWVPKEIRDSHYEGAKTLEQGAYHDGQNQSAYVGVDKRYYRPIGDEGHEEL